MYQKEVDSETKNYENEINSFQQKIDQTNTQAQQFQMKQKWQGFIKMLTATS